MTRFDRLEFDPVEPRPQLPTADDMPDRDEHFWLKAADVDRRQGQYESALRNYSRALELNRTLTAGWIGQVQMLIALGEYVEAELWSRKALEIFRNNGDLIAGRAHAMGRLANIKEALGLSDASFKQEGLAAYRWIVRGEIMVIQKEPVDQHCFDKAVQLDPDWLVLVEIAQIYLHYQRPGRAILYARKAAERAPESAHCWFVLGRCEQAMSLYPATKTSYSQCIELMPKHELARRALAVMDHEQYSLAHRLKRLFRLK